MSNNKNTSMSLMLSVCVAVLPLAACDKKPDAAPAAAAPQAQQAPAAPAYAPPTADQLYQLVGPIALFPDKLVAQVLAASSYPDQITAADNWLAQNKNLKGAQLQDAANQQPWDVSVKGLTQFPSVLDQMARNIPWTSALGDAYVNDPSDVMNAIQVMRQRAASSGNLKDSKQQRIAVRPRVQPAPPTDYAPPPGEPLVYAGPEMVAPPPETIVIEPAEPDVVYVPAYNPGVVYGQPLPVYPGYSYEPPAPYYPPGEIVTAGVITFGLGVAVGAVISHHDWGWNSWGVHWGGDGGGGNWRGGDRDRDHGWHRPAVVYNNNTYVSRSTTIVNRVTNNYNNTYNNSTVNNNTRNNFGGPGNNPAAANGARPPGQPGGGGAPNFFNGQRPNPAAPANPAQSQPPQQRPNQNATPFAGNPRPNHGQPDFSHMSRPDFGKTPPQANGGAPNANQLARPGFLRPAPGQPQASEPGQKPLPNQLQQNAQSRRPGQPRNLDAENPVNLHKNPFNGNVPRPNVNRPAVPEAARPQPTPQPQLQPQPQNLPNRQPEQFQHRPEGGQQMHQEPNRPAGNPGPQFFNHPESRPQASPQPHPQPQPQIQQPRPQPAPQPQMQRPQPQPQMQQPRPQPQVQAQHPPQQNHEQPHGNNIHPQKKDDDHK